MKKIIDFIRINIKKLMMNYPVTLITIFLETIMVSFFTDTNILDSDLFLKIVLFLLFYFLGSLFTEVIFDKKKKLYGYILFLVLSILLVYLVTNFSNTIIIKLIIFYVVVTSILIVYRLFRNSNFTLSEYLVRIYGNFIKTWIIYAIISSGMLLVSGIFTALIYDDFDIIARVELFIMGMYLVPSMLLNLSNFEKNELSFNKIIIHYILESLVIISMIIIYIYILKILITWEIPSNVVFRILGVLFLVAMPIWIMNNYYDDQLGKINRLLPGLFGPFVLIQIFTLSIRIVNNGLTILRYLGILLIIFEIIVIYLYYFKKDKLYYLFYVLIVLTFISTFMPFINMFSLSYYSQVKVLQSNLNNPKLDEVNINRIRGAYNYLKDNIEGDKYIDKYFDKETIDKINSLIKETKYDITDSIYFNVDSEEIDISSFDNLAFFTDYSYNETDKLIIDYHNRKIDITNDLNIYRKKVDYREMNDYYKSNNIIDYDNLRIIINSLDVRYIMKDKEMISSYNISGIILERK